MPGPCEGRMMYSMYGVSTNSDLLGSSGRDLLPIELCIPSPKASFEASIYLPEERLLRLVTCKENVVYSFTVFLSCSICVSLAAITASN